MVAVRLPSREKRRRVTWRFPISRRFAYSHSIVLRYDNAQIYLCKFFPRILKNRIRDPSENCAGRLVFDAEPPGRPSEGPSNPLEPAGDRPSDLVGAVLLHEVETFDDDVVLVGEAARQAPDPTGDEHAGLRVDKELR